MKTIGKKKSARLVARVAQRCRVAESIVEEILRTSGAVMAEQLAQGQPVKAPGIGTFYRIGIQRGALMKAMRTPSWPGEATMISVSPLFRAGRAIVDATRLARTDGGVAARGAKE